MMINMATTHIPTADELVEALAGIIGCDYVSGNTLDGGHFRIDVTQMTRAEYAQMEQRIGAVGEYLMQTGWKYYIEPVNRHGLVMYRGLLMRSGVVTAIVYQWSEPGVLTQLKRAYNKQRRTEEVVIK